MQQKLWRILLYYYSFGQGNEFYATMMIVIFISKWFQSVKRLKLYSKKGDNHVSPQHGEKSGAKVETSGYATE